MKKTHIKPKSTLWVKRLCVFLPLCLFALLPLGAQTFTQRVQKELEGGARVKIYQDASIEELVNGKKPERQPQRTTQAATQAGHHDRQTATTRENTPAHDNDRQTGRNNGQENHPTTVREASADSVAIVQQPRRVRKATGYRIQVFVGGKTRADHTRADQIGATLRTLFPAHKVYVKFYSPRWTCRLGDFATIAEAREVYNEVVRMGYDTATLVRGQVFLPY